MLFLEERHEAIFNLDLWTTWERDGRYFHYPDIKGELDASRVLPLQRFMFKGQNLLIPQGYEQILQFFYGDGWSQPDPNYAWYPRYDADDAFEFLRSSPGEVRIPEYPVKRSGLEMVEKDDLYFVHGSGLVEEQRLNATGMIILELCNGRNSCLEIIQILQQTFALESAPEVVVLEFLSNALKNGLIHPDGGARS